MKMRIIVECALWSFSALGFNATGEEARVDIGGAPQRMLNAEQVHNLSRRCEAAITSEWKKWWPKMQESILKAKQKYKEYVETTCGEGKDLYVFFSQEMKIWPYFAPLIQETTDFSDTLKAFYSAAQRCGMLAVEEAEIKSWFDEFAQFKNDVKECLLDLPAKKDEDIRKRVIESIGGKLVPFGTLEKLWCRQAFLYKQERRFAHSVRKISKELKSLTTELEAIACEAR